MTHTTHDGKALTLLVVEDDDGDFKAISRAFARSDTPHRIVRARMGHEALGLLLGVQPESAVRPPCLCLIDINMPQMSGMELIRRIRADEDLQRTVVFVLTTSNAQRDRDAAFDLHVAGYILKETAGQDFQGLVDLLDLYARTVELPA